MYTGMFAFFQRDFTSAIDLFKKVLKTVSSDIPAKVYLRQAMILRDTGVPDGWDGYLKINA